MSAWFFFFQKSFSGLSIYDLDDSIVDVPFPADVEMLDEEKFDESKKSFRFFERISNELWWKKQKKNVFAECENKKFSSESVRLCFYDVDGGASKIFSICSNKRCSTVCRSSLSWSFFLLSIGFSSIWTFSFGSTIFGTSTFFIPSNWNFKRKSI